MTHSDDLDRHVPLAAHSFQILLSLLDRELHGYSIIKDIEARTGGEMVLGTSTAYAAIKRMVENGLLEEASPDSEAPSGGPQRKVYRITGWGREVAKAEGRRISRLERMVAEKGLLDRSGLPAPGEARP
jgi:DNA-binding PadR family transcriptional regulator